jgi:hypothetical protein
MLYAACEQQGWVLRRAPVSAFYRKASLGSCVVCPPPLFTALWRPQAARGLYAPSGAARFYSRGPTRRIPGLCPQPPDFRVGTPRNPPGPLLVAGRVCSRTLQNPAQFCQCCCLLVPIAKSASFDICVRVLPTPLWRPPVSKSQSTAPCSCIVTNFAGGLRRRRFRR